ncbi:hypothetical protein L615_000200000330 [Nocardioides sp. J9]|uniref:hypothetical protein n=1 Tax=unclassified Nocardioides TaxID=2615069 RepID=UPI0004B11577|nr:MULTISPECIES: hypothetical protein [unclassified Nocardioides]TWH00823.1 hypothetical protein L615_000200000330 [Nocardioides sp. J9]
MTKTTSTGTGSGRHLESVGTTPADRSEEAAARAARLRDRHAQNIARLMEQRSDLRGVNKLADFVDDALRWTA